jgi:hypothetical protein
VVGDVTPAAVQLRIEVAGEPFWFWLPREAPDSQVWALRVEPADGPPQPGELWADANGAEYYATSRTWDDAQGAATPVIYLVRATGQAEPWQQIHQGHRGPLWLVRCARPQVPPVAAAALTPDDPSLPKGEKP